MRTTTTMGRKRRFCCLLFTLFCLGITTSNLADEKVAGVIFYRGNPDEPDELAKVRKFHTLEDFGNLINYTPVGETDSVRVFQKNLIGILHYPDLEHGQIATPKEKIEFTSLIERMQQALKRYPTSYHVLTEDLRRFEAAEQMLDQGNVLLRGNWKPESEIEIKIGPVSIPELEIDGQVYQGVRLTSINSGEVKFMHSKGITSKDIQTLSDDVISMLNRTSEELRIVKQTPVDEMDDDAKAASEKKILEDLESGIIIDLTGNRFTEVEVKTVSDDGILIFHSRGSANLSFDVLPLPIKIKFGYDPVAAAAARKAEEVKQAALRAEAMASAAAAAEEQKKKEELAKLLASAERIEFRITQVINEGILVWNLRDSKTELLKIDADRFDIADGELYTAWVVSAGTFDYESVIGVRKRVRAWRHIPID